MSDSNAYILGTDREELDRLELQHKVWLSESKKGWTNAGFSIGHSILDLGCGPGYCSLELADIVGSNGNIIALDRSEAFINHLNFVVNKSDLPVKPIQSDFDDMDLEDNSLDGMYCRWALAWVPNPKDVIGKIIKALKPGGKMVFHEYFNWSNHQVFPEYKNLTRGIAAALTSFKESDSEIDIGKYLPEYIASFGANIISTRLITKLASPNTDTWNWPVTFYKSYFPRLVEMGLLDQMVIHKAFDELKELQNIPYARIACPLMIEIVAEVK